MDVYNFRKITTRIKLATNRLTIECKKKRREEVMAMVQCFCLDLSIRDERKQLFIYIRNRIEQYVGVVGGLYTSWKVESNAQSKASIWLEWSRVKSLLIFKINKQKKQQISQL